MPVNLSKPDKLLPVSGIRLAAAHAGLRTTPAKDLVLFELSPTGSCAAVFTRNLFCAAPVQLAKRHLADTRPRYLLINAANANAGTGEQGLQDALQCCTVTAELAGCTPEAVLPFSTGVIGELLPLPKIESALPGLYAALSEDAWQAAATGIMTTDTVAKGVSRTIDIAGQTVTITGIAKGAGMICPNMATMLSFIATDAQIEQPLLKKLHRQMTEYSFNRITVDGDTSTNDAGVLMASGKAQAITETSPGYSNFVEALQAVYLHLAQAIVRDAEGASKFVTIEVCQGHSEQVCRNIAYTVAHSPLVKTALFASDANWGRILAAVGRGVPNDNNFDISKVQIAINGVSILINGDKDPAYTEAAGQKAMAADEIYIRIGLGQGAESFTLWTSDLSHEYVSINAEYRT